MANSDYVLRAGGYGFCPMAFLSANLDYLDSGALMTGYTSSVSDGIRVGMAARIGQEIVVVLARTGDNLTLGRGCCDTVPAPHDAGDPIWFFDDSIAFDTIEYAGTETIGVKVLPRTSSGGFVPVENSPPKGLTFNLRFARPYPPGLVEVNGNPWFEQASLTNIAPLDITWAHRDRITQQDQLVDHSEASIGPELGVTYKIRVYKADNTLIRTVTAIGADTYSYTHTMALGDFAVTVGTHLGYITLVSERDSLESFQGYRIDFEFDAEPWGLGYRLGTSLGGIPI